MTPRLPTRLWIDALRKRASVAGAFAMVIHPGDDDRGDMIVKVLTGPGEARGYARRFSADGSLSFYDLAADGATGAESELDAIIARRRASDPDLWVVEIEDREGRHFLTEPVFDTPF